MTIPKFRAWHKEKKVMAEVEVIRFQYKCVGVQLPATWVGNPTWMDETWNFDEIELMQFTGFNDKNGREIYVGDLAKVEAHYSDDDWIPEYLGNICYEAPSFYISSSGLLAWHCLWEASCNHGIEVIGNIYETPELLEKA